MGHRADWKQCSMKLVDFLSRRLSSTFRWNGRGIVCLPSRIPVFLKIKNTREMQGIVGQASDCVEVVSKIDWTLLHEIWWREIEKIKGDWRAMLWYGFFAWVHTHTISPRTNSTVVRVQVVGVYEVRTLAGMPGLVIALDPACACRWERRRTLKKLYSRSQLAPS